MVDCIVSFMIFHFLVHFFNSLYGVYTHLLTLSHVHIHAQYSTWLMVIQLDVSKFWKLIAYWYDKTLRFKSIQLTILYMLMYIYQEHHLHSNT